MKTPIRHLLALGAALILHSAGTASAQLIASDAFDYTPGALSGQGSASGGWAGAWNTSTGSNTVVLGSLSPGVTGNKATIDGTSGSSSIFRSLNTAISSGTVYIGFIIQRNTTSDRAAWLSFGPSSVFNTGVADGKLAMAIGGGGPSAFTSINATNGTPFQMVLKVQFNLSGSNERFDLFVNQATEGTPDATILSYNIGGGMQAFRLFAGGVSGLVPAQNASFDEIRISNSYSMAVVPEPSTFAMLLGGLALLRIRCRRA